MLGKCAGATKMLALTLLLAACSSGPRTGTVAPGFTAENAQGNTISLADHEGQVVILDFWAVW